MFIRLAWWEGQECTIVNELAVSQSEFSQRLALDQERRDWSIADQFALLQIDFQYIGTIVSESKNGLVGNLGAFVQFELERGQQ